MTLFIPDLYWTEDAIDHIWKRHRLTPEKVEQARSNAAGYEAAKYGRKKIVGQTDGGTWLIVIIDPRTGEVITARPADKDEQP